MLLKTQSQFSEFQIMAENFTPITLHFLIVPHHVPCPLFEHAQHKTKQNNLTDAWEKKRNSILLFFALRSIECFKIHLVISPHQKLICTVSGLCCKHPILPFPVYICIHSSVQFFIVEQRYQNLCGHLPVQDSHWLLTSSKMQLLIKMSYHIIGFVSLNIVSILFISVNISSFVLLLSIQ